MDPHLGVSFLSQRFVKFYPKIRSDNVADLEFGTKLLIMYRAEFLKSPVSAKVKINFFAKKWMKSILPLNMYSHGYVKECNTREKLFETLSRKLLSRIRIKCITHFWVCAGE